VVAVAAILGGAFEPGPRLVVGGLLAIVLAVVAGAWRGRLAPEEWALAAFIAWGVVAATIAGGAPLAAREVLTTWVVAWILWAAARRTGADISRLALAILVGAGLLLALGVGLEVMGMRMLRVGGMLENPNLTASLLVVTVPALLFTSAGRAPRWRLLVALCLVTGVVLTGSRAGLLALLGAGAMVLPRGRRRAVGLGLGVLGAGAVLIWRFLSQPDVLAWYRPAIWTAVLKLWAANPIVGVGPGGLVDAAGPVRLLHADHVGQHQFLIAYAESSPLALLVQTGAVGFVIAVLAAMLWVGRARCQGVLSSKPFSASLVAMVVMILFHDLLSSDVVLWWWALILGLLESAAGENPSSDVQTSGKGARAAMAYAAVFVVLWGMVAPAWARWLWRTGEPDVRLLERVTRAEPWYDAPLAWRTRALLLAEPWTWDIAAEALARSRRAVRVHPGAARRWADLAHVNARVVTDLGPWPDSVEGARNAFARACELEPHLPWQWLEWARFERALGHPDTASVLARRAVVEEPNTVRAWLFLARIELDSGRVEEARRALDRARAAAALRRRPGLNAYERELLGAPSWQFRELEEALE